MEIYVSGFLVSMVLIYFDNRTIDSMEEKMPLIGAILLSTLSWLMVLVLVVYFYDKCKVYEKLNDKFMSKER